MLIQEHRKKNEPRKVRSSPTPLCIFLFKLLRKCVYSSIFKEVILKIFNNTSEFKFTHQIFINLKLISELPT